MSKSSNTAKPTPSDKGGDSKEALPELSLRAQNLFLVMAMNMTWQLAIVVIVPIVGGHFLDEAFNSTPWLTIVGMIIAGFGVVGVLMRIVKIANEKTGKTGGNK